MLTERQLASFANNGRWSAALAALLTLDVRIRLKRVTDDEASDWGRFCLPVPNVVEPLSFGPVEFREIEWLEVDPIVSERRGALVDDLEIDLSARIEKFLRGSKMVWKFVDGKYQLIGYK